jgi:lactoylglutathione lyase
MRFYCDGLGCEVAERYELDSIQLPGLADALEVDGRAVIMSQMITHGGLRIELIEWSEPPAHGSPSASRNSLGLTHLSFFVDDVESMARRLVEHGGRLLPKTRQSPGIELVFLGTRTARESS